MCKKYFDSGKISRILPQMLLPLFVLFSLSTAGAIEKDSAAIRIDLAFRLLNSGKTDSAELQARTLEPAAFPAALKSHASRLALAGLRMNPGSHAWLDWTAKFDPKTWNPQERLWILDQALDAGYVQPFPPLFEIFSAPNPILRHQWEILQARREGLQQRWKEVDAQLANWKNNPDRKTGSGEILFWQAWANFYQGHQAEAETLLVLSSAYTEESASQQALEYRFTLQLDTGENLKAYFLGLPESPFSSSARLNSLQKIPVSSPLHPYALLEMTRLYRQSGKKIEEVAALKELSRDLSTLPARRALIRLARLRFEPANPDSAMAAYENLLLQYQQGVPSEFAKSRVQSFRNGGLKSP